MVIECPICLENFSKEQGHLPFKLSDCSHNICEGCLQKLKEEGKACPECRASFDYDRTMNAGANRIIFDFMDLLRS